MAKVLEFIFQDFTHWIGTLILLTAFRPFNEAFKFSLITRNRDR